MNTIRTARLAIRSAAVVLLGFTLVTGLGVRAGGSASAQSGPALFELLARGDALGIEIIATGFPVVPDGEVAFIGPGSSQASLNQFSGAAFASAPYPGDLVAALPSTINGLGTGTLPPAPAYPFYVATDSATTDDREEVGPYLLSAHTDGNRSTAESRLGLSTFSPEVVSITSFAEVTRDPDSGLLRSRATTRTAPFRVNDLVAVGEVRTDATFTIDPAEPDGATKTSSTSAGTITVAGVEVGLTDRGLVLADQPLIPIDVSALTALLADSGVEIELIPREETKTSISSSAVQLTYRERFPAPLLDTTVRVVLGRSSATLATATVPGVAEPPLAPGAAPPAASGQPPGGGGIGELGAPAPTPSADPMSPAITTAPAVPAGSNPAPVGGLADLSRFYPVLIAGALLALSSSRSVQWFTFRLQLAPTRTTP